MEEINVWIPPVKREDDGTPRMSGVTTRMIDEAIQTLFKRGIVEVRDHINTVDMNEYIGHKTVFRLQSEHSRFVDEHVEISIKPDGAYIIYLVEEKEVEVPDEV